MEIRKVKIIKSKKHLKWVAENYSCLICKMPPQVAHIRSLPDGNIGWGQKNDAYVIPLCPKHHIEQHNMNEIKFWLKYQINPIKVAIRLSKLSPCKKINKLESEGYFGNTNYFRVVQKDSLQP